MAKKKTKKETEKKGFQYTKELQGLLLVLIGLIGFGNFGPVGKIFKGFAVFLFGNWYILVLVLALVLGLYLIAKRKSPNYFTARLIGMYVLLIAILLFSHISYLKTVNLEGMDVLRTTLDNIMSAVKDSNELRNTGGGMIGGSFALMFVSLFDYTGTQIVIIVLALFGLIMLFDVTLGDMFSFLFKPFKRIKEGKHEKSIKEIRDAASDSVEENDEEEEEDKKIVITSVDDLTSHPVEQTPAAPIETDFDEESTEYFLPPITILDENKRKGKVNSNEFIASNTKILVRVLNDFGIVGKVTEVHVGPTVTQYEMELKTGTKLNRVLSINKEIALALAAKDVRIQAPIPGKGTIGIEIPNPVQSDVRMREILEGIPKKLEGQKLIAPLGKDIMGNCQFFAINKAPHMLIAGATGSGKSVCINNIITAILMRCKPDEVKLVLVDPKKVELNVYEGVPHLMRPVVTDPKKASIALQKIVEEMDRRYQTFHDSETKNLETYNEYVDKQNAKHPGSLEKMPYVLVIIDELADLMLVAAKEVEESITRITQLARAAGIHLIVATQRPSTDVITGLIKANIPSRISFAVSSSIDSRTILDMMGAEKLLGKGDMLFLPMGENAPIRIQGSFITDDEIKRVVDFVKRNGKPVFDPILANIDNAQSSGQSNGSYSGNADTYGEDPLYNEILEFAIKTGKISASLIQRKYHLGYNRAARIIDIMEEKGIVGAASGSKPRNVLVKLEDKKEE